MKILFISSGRNGDISELIKNQGKSITKQGIEIQYFTLDTGFSGYLKGIFLIREKIKKEKYDLLHAHYSLSAFAATLAGRFPMVVSLLGSDAYKPFYLHCITRLFSLYCWQVTIVKTKTMKERLALKNAEVIPNGVDISRFKPIPKAEARNVIQFNQGKKLVIFVANPARHEKNFSLALQAIEHLEDKNIELMPVFNITNEKIPYYMNAADVLLLTSKREGSVNVVKEAMACNLPVVSTDVGDVKENIKNLPGYYVCDSNPAALAEGISEALKYKGNLNGRDRILELGLDSETVAEKIIAIYKQVMGNVN
ncbi:MAG: glycosyltransferase [Candidatus Atribacteria bacterium]|nr:glycosyltransferase [Candidatus Atribacteria bacterium]